MTEALIAGSLELIEPSGHYPRKYIAPLVAAADLILRGTADMMERDAILAALRSRAAEIEDNDIWRKRYLVFYRSIDTIERQGARPRAATIL